MLIIDIKQYSEEYWRTRCGKPTASMAGKLVTSTGQISKQADFEAFKLADQLKNMEKPDSFSNEWTDRGHELEPKARELYQIVSGKKISETGMIFRDEKMTFGCSPDGVGIRNGVEIKCPSYEKHMKYLFNGILPTDYKPQVFSSLWVCDELESWDFFSYHPKSTSLLVTVTRENEEYKRWVDAFESYLPEFLKLVNGYLK